MTGDRELLLWPDGDMSKTPERWIRTGECIRCGACCEDDDRPHYLVGLLEDDAPEGVGACSESATGELPPGPIVAEDWDGRWVFWRQSGARHGPCPKWQGGGVCSAYGAEDFPHVCRKWPVLPSEMESYPACGFRFVCRSEGGPSEASGGLDRGVGVGA
jgi:hypothetical protein